uniref:THAP-type domain-containing protein n=1 Tax=Culex tarsalis TaxID=7177 RepID=A0A1Q3EY39_CULTA
MSRQPRRSCCYRNCAVINSEHPERTLFQFPKDEERAKRWSELGAVDTSVAGPKFMCDLHFSRIYMCFSSRRKMLLNTALPYEYGTEVENHDQQQQHEMILGGDSGPEMVGSTSSSQGDMNAEEHLDNTEYEMLDNEDNQMTEIIYMDEDLQQFNQEETILPKSPAKARIIKVEKLPTLVTSSSGTSTIPTLGTPQKNIILRKVKLKKRPSSVVTSPVLAKKSKPAIDEPPVETTVTTSPEKAPKTIKKVQAVKVTPSPASSSSSSATAEKAKPAKPVKAPSSPVKPLRLTIMEKRKESINEFIFKGEEYVQLPKEVYLQDLDDVDQELQQYKAKHSGEVEELEQQLEVCRAEQEQCQAERDQYKAENEKLAKKLEEYRMVIKNMKDVLGMFAGEDED